MKENKIPKKIYIHPDNDVIAEVLSKKVKGDIEYTRTDAFVEKALKWYCLDCECNDNCKDTKCFFYRAYERFLQGEENVIPPKFSARIFNEDGSTSDNWRYRHFIVKMQEAFIEKAAKWFEENLSEYCDGEDIEYTLNSTYNIAILQNERMIEDFKKEMKR